MKAYISGSARIAVLTDGVSSVLYTPDCKKAKTLPQKDTDSIFESLDDTVILDNTTQQSALRKLSLEVNKSDGLILLLSLLDNDIPLDPKLEISRQLSSILEKDNNIYKYLNSVMYSRPLPQTNTNLNQVRDKEYDCSKVNNLIGDLIQNQELAADLHSSFTDICFRNKLSEKEIFKAEGILTCLSVNYLFISGQIDNKGHGKLHFDCLSQFQGARIENSRQVANQYFKKLKTLVSTNIAPQISVENNIVEKDNAEKRLHKKKANNQLPKKSFQQVTSQIQQIKRDLRNHEIDKAIRFADELTMQQVQRQEHSYAARSLCQISEFAKHLKLYDLQLKWAIKASELAPNDNRTYGHIADAHLHLEDLDKAKLFFQKSVEGDGDYKLYGLTGLARIERFRSNYQEGLSYINSALEIAPDEPNALAVKAELLRDSGALSDALSVYESIVILQPESVKPLCGKASVLCDMRRFEESENTYREALSQYPADDEKSVTLCGLGFLLARQANFREAHKLLDESIVLSSFEEYVPVIVKAKAFSLEGKFSQAIKLLQKAKRSKSQFIDIRNCLIDSYILNYDFENATKELNEIKRLSKANEETLYLEAKLLCKQANFDVALEKLDSLKRTNPNFVKALIERADLLKSFGDFKESRKQYQEILEINKAERRAIMGIKLIDSLENKKKRIELSPTFYDQNKPTTVEDYSQAGIDGLILLSQGKVKDAKKLLSLAYNSGFSTVKNKFGAALSITRLIQQQHSSASKSLKKSKNNIVKIQQAIVYGEQDQHCNLKRSLDTITKPLPPASAKVISLIEKRYLRDSKQKPSFNNVIDAQIESIMLAA